MACGLPCPLPASSGDAGRPQRDRVLTPVAERRSEHDGEASAAEVDVVCCSICSSCTRLAAARPRRYSPTGLQLEREQPFGNGLRSALRAGSAERTTKPDPDGRLVRRPQGRRTADLSSFATKAQICTYLRLDHVAPTFERDVAPNGAKNANLPQNGASPVRAAVTAEDRTTRSHLSGGSIERVHVPRARRTHPARSVQTYGIAQLTGHGGCTCRYMERRGSVRSGRVQVAILRTAVLHKSHPPTNNSLAPTRPLQPSPGRSVPPAAARQLRPGPSSTSTPVLSSGARTRPQIPCR